MTLSTQYAEGETTFFSFSDLNHWKAVLAVKKNRAAKPMENIIQEGICDMKALWSYWWDTILRV
jgi:hypothetical protein